MHAHNNITSAVAAMDSCFILVRTHQHGIASTVSLTITDPAFTAEASAKHSFKRQLHRTHAVAVGWEPQAVPGKGVEMGSAFTDRCAAKFVNKTTIVHWSTHNQRLQNVVF